ncbi:MAG: NAD-dependent dehydratase, partial [Candidatus Magasanikbacteria bacterium CG10_big_fil_rev_8_21_14_0_10_40_10]
MRILVTGGAGFIGSHLCQRLLAESHEVIALDNFFTSRPDNIEDLRTNPNFTFLKKDIIEPFFVEQKIDQIYNLACPASPMHYQQNPVRTVKANTIGLINVLGLARKHNARILQASTSEVYGDPDIHPQTEDY